MNILNVILKCSARTGALKKNSIFRTLCVGEVQVMFFKSVPPSQAGVEGRVSSGGKLRIRKSSL